MVTFAHSMRDVTRSLCTTIPWPGTTMFTPRKQNIHPELAIFCLRVHHAVLFLYHTTTNPIFFIVFCWFLDNFVTKHWLFKKMFAQKLDYSDRQIVPQPGYQACTNFIWSVCPSRWRRLLSFCDWNSHATEKLQTRKLKPFINGTHAHLFHRAPN